MAVRAGWPGHTCQVCVSPPMTASAISASMCVNRVRRSLAITRLIDDALIQPCIGQPADSGG